MCPQSIKFLANQDSAPSVEEGLRTRMLEAEPPPKPKSLRVSLPGDLRSIMLPDLPPNIRLTPGRIEIEAPTAIIVLESLMTLALVMQNDLDRFQAIIEPPPPTPDVQNDELCKLFGRLRGDVQWARGRI